MSAPDELVRVKAENGAHATLYRSQAEQFGLDILDDRPAADPRGFALSDKPNAELIPASDPGDPSTPTAPDYGSMSAADLRTEVERRGLTTDGTSKAAYAAALQANDAEHGA